MIWSSLLSAGAFSLAAQAFLVLPETNSLPPEITGLEDSLPPQVFPSSDQKITLDCSSCPFALATSRDGHHEWTSDVQSDLEMKFTSDGQKLLLNNVPFYPMESGNPPQVLSVTQKKKDGEESTMEGYNGELRISYSVEYSEQKMPNGDCIVSILMTIMGLDGQMVKIDNLNIRATKAADGKLFLGQVDAVPASPNAPDAKCENILCRIFTKLITGAHKAKASAKGAAHKMKCLCVKCMHKIMGHKHHSMPHHIPVLGGGMNKPHIRPDGTMELPSHIQFRPMGGHMGHHHHNHRSGFLAKMSMVMMTAVKVVFVPILIGVAFGMAASAIGMLVGQAIVFLWLKFRRTPETGAYERIETDEKEAPPAYQDVPAGEAVSEKEVEAKA